MQVSKKQLSDTEVVLTIIPNEAELQSMKDHVLTHFIDRVKLPGFRNGKAPLSLIEKNVDPASLQQEFLEEAIGQMYQKALSEQQIRVVGQPAVDVTKFVPFTTLEFEAKVPVVGKVTVPDYTKIKLEPTKVNVTSKDVEDVVVSLQQRLAEKNEVTRPAKTGDEVVIDFSGKDSKGHSIKGADGQDYPLILGSNAFIPGFETNIIGIKSGQKKTFILTFPKDYGVSALASKKIHFSVTVKKVHELVEPKPDDDFAAKAGPFKTLQELKADIKRQLTIERQNEAERQDESELVKKITDKSKVTIPEVLVEETIENMMRDLKQNLAYRSQTYPEFLDQEAITDEHYRKEVLKPQATERVKAGLVLAEIAEREKLNVSDADLEIRIQVLKGQYQDKAMQAELDKPENRRDIASRLLTEKVLAKLKGYSLKKST